MKKIMDHKDTMVSDMLRGYQKCYQDRCLLKDEIVLLRKEPKKNGLVRVMIGNGSGHEPAMIDLVGKGLFDANVCGRIFTAPSPLDMMKGIKALYEQGASQILILVSSHAGDILNAKMAIMLAKAEGYDVRMVVLWDDISSAPKGKERDRRGTSGLFFTFKIVCAAAEAGYDMEALIELAKHVRDNTRTLSVAITPGTHPETMMQTCTLAEDEIEIGMGVHGEAGNGRRKHTSAKELVTVMVDQILEDKEFCADDKVMVLVNNCGATTRMELMIVYGHIYDILEAKGLQIERSWVGTYVTTQEMGGFAISICACDETMLSLYDAPADSVLF